MSKVQMLRASVNQRLTAAAEEIFVLFERTIAEYEEELSRSKEENKRQRKLLDAVFKPQLQLHRAGVQQPCDSKEVPPESHNVQQPFKNREEVPGSSLNQQDPDPPPMKEEQEEVWTSQEGDQFQGLEEADTTKYTCTHFSVKSEDDKEKPQSSHLHQTLTEQMETEADGEDCGGPEPDRNSHPDTHLQPDTDDFSLESHDADVSDGDSTETKELQSDLNSLENTETLVSDMKSNTGSAICSQCDATFTSKETLQIHLTLGHCSGLNLFSCHLCDQTFSHRIYLKSHMSVHKGVKRLICCVCKEGFAWRSQLKRHKCVGETPKPVGGGSEAAGSSVRVKELRSAEVKVSISSFSCSLCEETFDEFYSLERHLKDHKTKKPFSCPFCGKGFAYMQCLREHIAMHTGEKPYSCRHCDKRFTWSSQIKNHKCVHPKTSQLHQSRTEKNRKTHRSKVRSTSVAVKKGRAESKAQSSKLHQMETKPDPDRYLQPISDDEASEFERIADDVKEPVKEPLQCPLCCRTFTDHRGMRNHLTGHSRKKKPFPCPFCDTVLGTKHTWLKHVKSHFWP